MIINKKRKFDDDDVSIQPQEVKRRKETIDHEEEIKE